MSASMSGSGRIGASAAIDGGLVTTATAGTTASSGWVPRSTTLDAHWTLIGRSLDARPNAPNAPRTLAAAVWCYTERLNACERLFGDSQIMEEKRGEEAGRGEEKPLERLAHARAYTISARRWGQPHGCVSSVGSVWRGTTGDDGAGHPAVRPRPAVQAHRASAPRSSCCRRRQERRPSP